MQEVSQLEAREIGNAKLLVLHGVWRHMYMNVQVSICSCGLQCVVMVRGVSVSLCLREKELSPRSID